ncbi:hypothetical protein NDU88_000247 [Pleurodeles waltl]|uniref:Uncharacterized protein n=1 Tax=Pleurodeles waltl TaxID=8319 RepID=A0AAV7N7E0_PLEWA|nr:hypothetical protein NDU88_000247 [Pleurodeles waltl]
MSAQGRRALPLPPAGSPLRHLPARIQEAARGRQPISARYPARILRDDAAGSGRDVTAVNRSHKKCPCAAWDPPVLQSEQEGVRRDAMWRVLAERLSPPAGSFRALRSASLNAEHTRYDRASWLALTRRGCQL